MTALFANVKQCAFIGIVPFFYTESTSTVPTIQRCGPHSAAQFQIIQVQNHLINPQREIHLIDIVIDLCWSKITLHLWQTLFFSACTDIGDLCTLMMSAEYFQVVGNGR